MIKNLIASSKGIAIVKSIDSYWKAFHRPEGERRIRVPTQDIFSKRLTLLITNEISRVGQPSLGGKINAVVEITLLTENGS